MQEFETLAEAVKWLEAKIAEYKRKGGKQWDYAINYHASHLGDEVAAPVSVLFIMR